MSRKGLPDSRGPAQAAHSSRAGAMELSPGFAVAVVCMPAPDLRAC